MTSCKLARWGQWGGLSEDGGVESDEPCPSCSAAARRPAMVRLAIRRGSTPPITPSSPEGRVSGAGGGVQPLVDEHQVAVVGTSLLDQVQQPDRGAGDPVDLGGRRHVHGPVGDRLAPRQPGAGVPATRTRQHPRSAPHAGPPGRGPRPAAAVPDRRGRCRCRPDQRWRPARRWLSVRHPVTDPMAWDHPGGRPPSPTRGAHCESPLAHSRTRTTTGALPGQGCCRSSTAGV